MLDLKLTLFHFIMLKLSLFNNLTFKFLKLVIHKFEHLTFEHLTFEYLIFKNIRLKNFTFKHFKLDHLRFDHKSVIQSYYI